MVAQEISALLLREDRLSPWGAVYPVPSHTRLRYFRVFIVTHTETLPLDESRRPESLDGEAGFVDLFMRGTSYAICRGTGCDGDSRDRKGNAL